MSLPQIFEFDNHAVRTIEKDGDVWFVAADVTDVLGYKNGRKAISDHCKGCNETLLPTAGGNQTFTILPERDLYRLIMKSKLPSAEKFENWVVSEVLPTIRKTGTYTPPTTPALQIAEAMLLAGRMIEEQKNQIEQRDKLIAIAAPKAAIADRIANADGWFTLRDASKALKTPERKFIADLQLRRWLYRDMKGRLRGRSEVTPRYINHKITPIPVDGEPDRVSMQPMITAEGLTKLAGLFNVELELQEVA